MEVNDGSSHGATRDTTIYMIVCAIFIHQFTPTTHRHPLIMIGASPPFIIIKFIIEQSAWWTR